MKVAVSKSLSPYGMEYLSQFAQVVDLNAFDPMDALKKIKECDADAFISRGVLGTREFFEGLSKTNCRIFARHGTGLDGIDIPAATENGIIITAALGANSRSVAEYTVSLITALFKKIPETNAKAHAGIGRFAYMEHCFEGKKVYIIGFGNIGRKVASMCKGLGMLVSAYDAFLSQEDMEKQGVEYMEQMEDGLGDADVVSLHTPLLPDTRGMVNSVFLSKMKRGAFLVNTARAGLMIADDVISAVEDGTLGGAAFDDAVMENEQVTKRLQQCEKIIFSPHVAAQTMEALDAMAKSCTDSIVAVMNHERWPITVNKEVYDQLGWK